MESAHDHSQVASNAAPLGRVRFFGDNKLIEDIGGGMGFVYRAKQTTLKRVVALKLILTGQLAWHSIRSACFVGVVGAGHPAEEKYAVAGHVADDVDERPIGSEVGNERRLRWPAGESACNRRDGSGFRAGFFSGHSVRNSNSVSYSCGPESGRGFLLVRRTILMRVPLAANNSTSVASRVDVADVTPFAPSNLRALHRVPGHSSTRSDIRS
jgi:hypothetical protein